MSYKYELERIELEQQKALDKMLEYWDGTEIMVKPGQQHETYAAWSKYYYELEAEKTKLKPWWQKLLDGELWNF